MPIGRPLGRLKLHNHCYVDDAKDELDICRQTVLFIWPLLRPAFWLVLSSVTGAIAWSISRTRKYTPGAKNREQVYDMTIIKLAATLGACAIAQILILFRFFSTREELLKCTFDSCAEPLILLWVYSFFDGAMALVLVFSNNSFLRDKRSDGMEEFESKALERLQLFVESSDVRVCVGVCVFAHACMYCRKHTDVCWRQSRGHADSSADEV